MSSIVILNRQVSQGSVSKGIDALNKNHQDLQWGSFKYGTPVYIYSDINNAYFNCSIDDNQYDIRKCVKSNLAGNLSQRYFDLTYNTTPYRPLLKQQPYSRSRSPSPVGYNRRRSRSTDKLIGYDHTSNIFPPDLHSSSKNLEEYDIVTTTSNRQIDIVLEYLKQYIKFAQYMHIGNWFIYDMDKIGVLGPPLVYKSHNGVEKYDKRPKMRDNEFENILSTKFIGFDPKTMVTREDRHDRGGRTYTINNKGVQFIFQYIMNNTNVICETCGGSRDWTVLNN